LFNFPAQKVFDTRKSTPYVAHMPTANSTFYTPVPVEQVKVGGSGSGLVLASLELNLKLILLEP
jgi:hypothetical protein